MPKSLDIPDDVFKRKDGRWVRKCPVCLENVDHLRRNYAVHSSINKQPCIRCSNINNHPSGMVGPVRVAWYNSFRKSASSRGLSWDITIEDIASLYEQQKERCALSGRFIKWATTGWDHTASIDRIDNDKGYSLDNIQLVHKDVNMCRGRLNVEDFVSICEDVTRYSGGY